MQRESPSAGFSQNVSDIAGHDRWLFLDAIRGIASLLVVLQHILWFHSPVFEAFFSSVWSPGRFGVVAFFIVSGFIVPRSLELKGDVRKFWISRFFRLYPAYWFSLLLIFALAAFGIGHQPSVKTWVANLTMLQGFVRIYDINVVSWTLGLEIALYVGITIAFVNRWLSRTWFISISLLSILGAASVIFPAVLHVRFPAGAMAVFGSIIEGIVLYRYFSAKLSFKEAAIITVLCFATISVSSMFNYAPIHQVGVGNQPTQFCAIFSVFSAFAFFIGMMKFRNLRFPSWVLWLGKVSYSLYLLHPVAGIMISHEGNPYLKDSLLLGTSLALAWFGYTFVELPSAKLNKRILAKT